MNAQCKTATENLDAIEKETEICFMDSSFFLLPCDYTNTVFLGE